MPGSWRDRPLLIGQSQLIANAEQALCDALQELSEQGKDESDLARRMRVTLWQLRKILHRYREQVKPYPHGGARYRFTLTPELLDELSRDGVPSVARRLGIHEETIRKRLRKHALGG